MPDPRREPLPTFDIVRIALSVVSLLMFLGWPIVFFLGLEYLPRHGDGMGVIGSALALAVLDVALAVTIAVVVVCAGRLRAPSPDRDVGAPPTTAGEHRHT